MELNTSTTIGLFITDGVGIRNFVLGGLMEEAARKKCKIVVFHFFPEAVIQPIKQDNPEVIFEKLPDFQESSSVSFWKKVMEYAHMHKCNTFAMRYNLSRPIIGSVKAKIKHKLTGFIASFYKTDEKLNSLQQSLLQKVSEENDLAFYESVLQKHQIDILFITNQKSASSSPMVLAGKKLNIPSTVFIFSWDNLTTKGKFLSPFDHFFVWGKVMKDELKKYYPQLAEDRMHIVGTPQFHSYFKKEYYQTKEAFCKAYDLDPKHPIILYSGGTPDTVPQDPYYVESLGKIIAETPQLKGTQLILRPSPVDNGKRFEHGLSMYPNIKLLHPKWTNNSSENWNKVLPQKEDQFLLLNTLLHADIIINTASTMTIDAFLLGKPVINTAFDRTPYLLGNHIHEVYYNFEHYQPIITTQSAKVVTSTQALEQAILDYLNDPTQDQEKREQLLALEIGVPVPKSNQVIIEQLMTIANQKPVTQQANSF